jgi:hypothetical protein
MGSDDFHLDGYLPESPIAHALIEGDNTYINHLERAHASVCANNDELVAQIVELSRQKSALRSALAWMVLNYKSTLAKRRVVNLDECFAEAEAALKGSEA